MKKIIAVVIGAILLVISLGYIKETYKQDLYIPDYEKEQVNVTDYYIYGNHLGIDGTLKKLKRKDVTNAVLVFQNKEGETEYPIDYTYEKGTLKFQVNQQINQGIDLNKIQLGDYYISLKVTSKKKDYYYTLTNQTDYKNLDYYTLTQKKQNNLVRVSFTEIYNENKVIPYASVKVENVKLPNNIYDFVIDAGHGGNDPGAINGEIQEKNITLEMSKELKKQLEALGYKVALTRNDDSTVTNYGRNGRTIVPNQMKAKYVISLEANSDQDNNQRGMEIYVPNDFNFDLAKKMIENSKTVENVVTSEQESYRVDEGIYQTFFTKEQIEEQKKLSESKNYKPYKISTDTVFEAILRETGGQMTHAFVDGRNAEDGTNPYSKDNIGVEAYRIRLGYMSNETDLAILKNQQTAYMKALAKTFENK